MFSDNPVIRLLREIEARIYIFYMPILRLKALSSFVLALFILNISHIPSAFSDSRILENSNLKPVVSAVSSQSPNASVPMQRQTAGDSLSPASGLSPASVPSKIIAGPIEYGRFLSAKSFQKSSIKTQDAAIYGEDKSLRLISSGKVRTMDLFTGNLTVLQPGQSSKTLNYSNGSDFVRELKIFTLEIEKFRSASASEIGKRLSAEAGETLRQITAFTENLLNRPAPKAASPAVPGVRYAQLGIQKVPEQKGFEDQTIEIPFSLTNFKEGPISILTFSHDESLLPNTNIKVTRSDSGGVISAVPARDQTGSVTFKLQAAQGNQIAEQSFVIHFQAVDDPAIVTPVTEQRVMAGETLKVNAFVKDTDTPLSDYIWQVHSSDESVVPSQNVKVVPHANGYQIQITAHPGGEGLVQVTIQAGGHAGTQIKVPVFVTQALAGDLNQDGLVNENDLSMLSDHLNSFTVTRAGVSMNHFDIDRDGIVDRMDALRLKQIITGVLPADLRVPVRQLDLRVNGHEFFSKMRDRDYPASLTEIDAAGTVRAWQLEYELKGYSRLQQDVPPINLEFKKKQPFNGTAAADDPAEQYYKKLRVVNDADHFWSGRGNSLLREYAGYEITRILGVPTPDVVGFARLNILPENSKLQIHNARSKPVMLLQRDNEFGDPIPFLKEHGYSGIREASEIKTGEYAGELGDGIFTTGYNRKTSEGKIEPVLLETDPAHMMRYDIISQFLESKDRSAFHNEDYGFDPVSGKFKVIPFDFDDAFSSVVSTFSADHIVKAIQNQTHLSAEEQKALLVQYYDMGRGIFNNPETLNQILNAVDRFPFDDEKKNVLKTYIKAKFYLFAAHFNEISYQGIDVSSPSRQSAQTLYGNDVRRLLSSPLSGGANRFVSDRLKEAYHI